VVGGNAAPSFTFIVAAYNAEATLAAAIDSVLRQGYGDWEVIVVDDGSTDRTLEIARAYSERDGRVKVLTQANAGAAAARNSAIKRARSTFIAYLDADDMLADNHLSVMLDLMRLHPGFDIYSSDGVFVRADGSTEPVFGYEKIVFLTIEDLLKECLILGGGALVRGEVLRSLGGFREHMYGEDYDLWLRALASGYTHVATPERLYVYHRSVSGQKSEDTAAGTNSAAVALGDLLKSGLLSEDQQALARLCMANNSADWALELQARQLRATVERVFGERFATPVIRAIHLVSWITRPLRWMLARRSAARRNPAAPANLE
jgi:GT2 family glycosyltransferase